MESVRLPNWVSLTKYISIENDHLNDEDKRKILVEGSEHCRDTDWVVVGIAAWKMGIRCYLHAESGATQFSNLVLIWSDLVCALDQS